MSAVPVQKPAETTTTEGGAAYDTTEEPGAVPAGNLRAMSADDKVEANTYGFNNQYFGNQVSSTAHNYNSLEKILIKQIMKASF